MTRHRMCQAARSARSVALGAMQSAGTGSERYRPVNAGGSFPAVLSAAAQGPLWRAAFRLHHRPTHHLTRTLPHPPACRSGAVERQLRLNSGKLPVAYRTEPEGRYLYVLDDALTTYTADESGLGDGKPPVPPCIIRVGKSTQVALEVDDRGKRALVLRVTADFVRVQVSCDSQSWAQGWGLQAAA